MKETVLSQKTTVNSESQQPRLSLLLAFIACYLLCAAIFQVRSRIPPWVDRAPIEFFTASLLWMLSLMSVLTAMKYTSSRWKLIFWLMSCAALSALALDEIFGFHERPEQLRWFNDDYFKVVSWLATAVVLLLIFRMERPVLRARLALYIGYLFNSMWILVDLGDGEFFRVPFVSIYGLKWSEEFFELFFLASYLIGFILIYTKTDIGDTS